MNVVDLHPEDLLEKDARGALTDAERARLEAHLERCVTCRFERSVRSDFATELEECELSPHALAALVEGRRSDPRTGAPEDAELPPRRSPPSAPLAPLAPLVSLAKARSRRGRWVWLGAAAALLVGGAAGAGARTWTRLASLLDPAPSVESGPVDATPRRTAPPRRPEIPAPPSAPPAELTASPPLLAPPAVPPPVSAPPVPRMSVPAAESASMLFDAAIAARRHGDHTRALALSRQLQARYPRSREAHVSYATMGQLLLDRGEPGAALTSFDAYRAGGAGELDEAVMVGRANALERLGRTAEARGVWSELLAAYPSSPYAHHARVRLERSP
jgi:TolA-binding protein